MISSLRRHQFARFFARVLPMVLLFLSVGIAHATVSTACPDGSAGPCLGNPLNSSFSSIPTFIAGALKVMVMVALPIISLFIVYSGFMFVSARGNTSKLETAKNNFIYVIIGTLLILGAWVIATLISGTVTQLIGN